MPAESWSFKNNVRVSRDSFILSFVKDTRIMTFFFNCFVKSDLKAVLQIVQTTIKLTPLSTSNGGITIAISEIEPCMRHLENKYVLRLIPDYCEIAAWRRFCVVSLSVRSIVLRCSEIVPLFPTHSSSVLIV